jgi:CBS domain-containing protein
MTLRDEGDAASRAVHVRRTIGQVREPELLTVSCPRKARSVPLETCLGCEHCTSLFLDSQAGQSVLRCTAEPSLDGRRRLECTADRAQSDWTPISDIMPGAVLCVRPDLDLESLTSLLLERGISAAPVVDDQGHAIGVVSKTDLLRFSHDEPPCSQPLAASYEAAESELEPGFHMEPLQTGKVSDVMTPVAFTLSESASIANAAALMAYEGIHQVPVTGLDHQVVGMISTLDILRWVARRAGYAIARE